MSLATGPFTLLLACSVFIFFLHAYSCCLSEVEIRNHPRVSLASLLGEEQTVARTKRGGGWGFPSKTVGAELRAIPVEWWYNWGNYIPDTDAANFTQVSGVDFVPMIYGICCGLDQLPDGLPQNTTALLGFNEPNHMEESNLTPEAAAQLWPRLQAAAEKLGARLGSPAAAVCGANCVVRNPFEWWDQFFGNCTGCRVDFIATHYYTCSPQYLQWFLNDIWERYQRPIWLTELACPNENGTLSRQVTFMRNALKVLDEDDAVERYAWFAPHTEDFGWIGPTASLFLPDSNPPQLSALGRIYAGYAVPKAVATNGSAALSAADVAALTQPLTAVNQAGSWLAACGACVSGDSAVESALTGTDAHCRDCGMLPIGRGQGLVQGAAHGVLKGYVGSQA